MALTACSSDGSDSDDSAESSSSGGGSSGSGHGSAFATCDTILDACHALDTGDPGPIHDCHELAHGATSEQPCLDQKDACLAVCVTDGGHN